MCKSERKAYLAAIRGRYRKATRAQKTRILDEFLTVCGYHRKYALRRLSQASNRTAPGGPGRPSRYTDEAVLKALRTIWLATDQMASKRLMGALPLWLPHYEAAYGVTTFKTTTDYPNYADRVPEALVAYRNWDSTLPGHPDCDGVLAVALPARFESFDRLVQKSGAALSIRWSDALKMPGQLWTRKEHLYPMEQGVGPDGPDRTRRHAMSRSGFCSPYDEAVHLYAVQHRRGPLHRDMALRQVRWGSGCTQGCRAGRGVVSNLSTIGP